jgi:diaminohydroxyphosphoribosylaminopyrimidine deaminase / 5-amino-6-(5-phosphoribosylamino)uracil reductase
VLRGARGRRIFDAAAETLHLRTRDPEAAIKELFARDRQHVFLEGGPTLAAAFLAADLVDEVVTYVAPMLLGSGRSAVGDLGIRTVSEALHLPVTDVTVLEPELDTLSDGYDVNVRITMTRPLSPAEAVETKERT